MTPRTLLDSASGLPLRPQARDALLAALEDGWADPARLYASGRRARQLLDGARAAVAQALGARPDEVVFTANGTAAAYAGVRGLAAARARVGRHVVHSAVEHSAVLHACAELDAEAVGVQRTGAVEPEAFAAALRSDTALACLLAASHEVGTLQPVEEVAAACADRGVPLLVDAAQVVGRAPVPAGWSALTASARKWGGPGGVGVLAVRTGTRFRPGWPEDEHELGRSPGSVALPAVVAAAVALQAAVAEQAAEDARQRALVDRVRAAAAALPDVEVVGDPVRRLPHLVTFSCLYVDGEQLVRALDALGFEVSSGSSCTSSTLEPSHVLVAMGVLTHGNVRVSLSPSTTEEDVDRFLAALPGVLERLRAEAGVAGL
ncbi:MAG: cysteine desulfurase family protein [Mycobacteriales bacterium]